MCCNYLQRNYVFRLRTLLAIGDVKLHFLTIGQGAEAIAFDSAEVNEHVGTIFAFDEAESLALVKPFNGSGSCGHN